MAKKQKVSVVKGVLTVEYESLGKVFSVDLAKYPANVQDSAREHGFKQKFGDAESGGTAAEKYAEVQMIHASLLAGEWNRTATPDPIPMILECVARIKGVPLDKVQTAAAKLPEAEVKEWGTSAEVKAMRLKILAERAKDAAKGADAKLGKIAGIDA